MLMVIHSANNLRFEQMFRILAELCTRPEITFTKGKWAFPLYLVTHDAEGKSSGSAPGKDLTGRVATDSFYFGSLLMGNR